MKRKIWSFLDSFLEALGILGVVLEALAAFGLEVVDEENLVIVGDLRFGSRVCSISLDVCEF